MARAGVIAAGIAGVLALGVAGFFANEWRVCRNMEDDFLRSVDGYTSNVYAGALAGAVGVEVDEEEQKSLREMSLNLQEMQLTAIYQRCGEDAGRAATMMASDEVRERMKEFPLIP